MCAIMSAILGPDFVPLNDHNYLDWSRSMQAHLMQLAAYDIVLGTEVEPVKADYEGDTAGFNIAKRTYTSNRQKAAGSIYGWIDAQQHVHLQGEQRDPKVMWDRLKAAHQQQTPGQRFNAYSHVFTTMHQKDSTLESLCARVEIAMKQLQAQT